MSASTNLSLLCVFCRKYLVDSPRQAPCGDRLCGACFEELRQSDQQDVTCPDCHQQIILAKCFRDKAVELELASTTARCPNQDCPWEGQCTHYLDHLNSCRYSLVSCPNAGCNERVRRSDVEQHVSECGFTPVSCEWCRTMIPRQDKDAHLEHCQEIVVTCINSCGAKCRRRELPDHISDTCPLQARVCPYKQYGCTYIGKPEDLNKHEAENVAYHLKCISLSGGRDHEEKSIREVAHAKFEAIEKQILLLQTENTQLKSEITRLQPLLAAVMKVEQAIQQLQEGFGEMALMVQTLQATSYTGTFIWKVPEVQRRRNEAKIGKTISLYSAPFYTGRHGYKLCLRLYMDGDGSGKGTHLSFFLTILRGEYDALLNWPFKQAVTLMLLDQDRQKDIVQSFRPEPTSASFQRPRNEMNIASGCPLFAPLSILDNLSYVKEDTVFLKCKIDCTGLESIR